MFFSVNSTVFETNSISNIEIVKYMIATFLDSSWKYPNTIEMIISRYFAMFIYGFPHDIERYQEILRLDITGL